MGEGRFIFGYGYNIIGFNLIVLRNKKQQISLSIQKNVWDLFFAIFWGIFFVFFWKSILIRKGRLIKKQEWERESARASENKERRVRQRERQGEK